MPALEVRGLELRHGLLLAVRDLSLQVEAGETLALVGANGAGKSSLLRAIAGAHRPTRGAILLDGDDVTSMPAYRRVARGVALVPEGRRLFPSLSVTENLTTAKGRPVVDGWTVDAVLEAFPMLQAKRNTLASNLSGGERQATAIGRALMCNPTVLLLDEVSLGLAPVVVDDVYRSLRRVRQSATAVVLVEQDLSRAMSEADQVVCMLEGRAVLSGPAASLSRQDVTEAYFGLQGGAA